MPNSPKHTIVQVALAIPMRRNFDYIGQNGHHYRRGSRVKVGFGSRELIGIVTGISDSSSYEIDKLKPITELIDDEALLSDDLLSLAEFCARYYQSPLGEVLQTFLPTLLRQGAAAAAISEKGWRLSNDGLGLPTGALKGARKQAELLKAFQQTLANTNCEEANANWLSKVEVKSLGLQSSTKALKDKNLIEEAQRTLPLAANNSALQQEELPLNDEQMVAFNQLRYQEYNCFLLDGTTGSGKTEVYLQAISQILKLGRQALVLIPEIGLTPQTLSRFRNRFAAPVVAIHSGLNDRERLSAWLMAKHGQAGIIVGTRSAIFTPLANPGIIIIDEEHDLSFKQQDGVRYSARDLANIRAKELNIPLILGTATPALETLNNAITGRYEHLRLTKRAGNAKPPTIFTQDIKKQALTDGLSQESVEAISHTISSGEQALVFLNRRGFAPALICHDCGWVAECGYCSSRMTLHRSPRHLRCHHCDRRQKQPQQCPKCFSQELIQQGYGTERTEESLRQYFPDTPIHRVDRDTTRRKQAMHELLEQVGQGDACILVGTQMLAKGHHFPNVTLVVIVDADGGLFSGDFRGPERMGQLITQVAGRSGRAEKPGKVIIQTHNCDHPLIEMLTQKGYHLFARQILRERQLANMPPYRHLALLHCDSPNPSEAEQFLQQVRHWLEQQQAASPQLMYLGPFPAPMEKRKNMYRYQLQFNASHRGQLQALLQALCIHLEQGKNKSKLRWSMDVDPLDMM